MGTAEEAAVEAEKGRPLEPARRRTDVLVIGAGLAGLAAALAAAAAGLRVTVLSRTPPEGSNSARAQGGIAAALGEDDDADLHASDTLHVGAGLSRVEAVAVLTREAPAVVRALADLGVPFARRNGTFRLGLEAGHSRRRIVHTEGGLTGRSVMAVMAAAADRHERVDSHHGWEVEELVVRGGRCRGAVARCGPRRVRWDADAVVLATGGFAALFPRSSNAPETVGSGTVAAYRAGAAVADLEFVQFHPTVLALRGAPALLLSEALRGEGAHVVDASGRRFLFDYDSRGELAPRDVLARAILEEVDRRGEPCAYLSLRHLEAEAVRRRFGALAAALAEAGLDLARDPLPILPAAHFTMGGVLTDLDGRTNLPGLLACGEAACTGVHGA
ncbi:MAG: FAD-dependent oxidoreductase, partial [Chloroflexi bacterium]|nr:FAD-dependent oxidoreductase [Chloroflexota bacterium]